MNYYPVFINIENRKCVVIGGGEVAERKVERLITGKADVVVVARNLTSYLESLVDNGTIRHIQGEYKDTHIEGAFIVIGATDSDDVNKRIYRDTREKGILVNIVDDPEKCDFILPSIMQQGDLSIAISTGGKSPALARTLREELETQYGHEYKILLDIMGDLRAKVIAQGRTSDDNKKLFESVLRSDILDHIREKNWDKIRKIIYDLTGEAIHSKFAGDSEP
ncbi:MAG: bifunctional precorrin-2 dehydrogenase/sirohydrochlorin ferrochelatase [Deltaproteobacteria bacterium]|nr:bifunctional precorrin-2 dehydrogenase/sirohydrochlorin ferrochelatase [Deltaproteobacteria bacterium]